MNYSSSLVNQIILKAEQDAFFSNIRLMHSYAKTVKPTLLKSAVIAFSCRRIHLQPCAIGENADAGDIEISAGIYVPYINDEITGGEIAKRLCGMLFDMLHVMKVSISAPASDAETECMVTKAVFTLNDRFGQEDADDE